MRDFCFKTLVAGLALGAFACGSTVSKDGASGGANAESETDGTTNGAANGATTGDTKIADVSQCDVDQVLRDGACEFATRRLSIEVERGYAGWATACGELIVDVDEYQAWRDTPRWEVLEENDECRLVRFDGGDDDGGFFDGTGMEAIVIGDGLRLHTDEFELPFDEPLFDRCREVPDEVDELVTNGETYQIESGLEDFPPFEASIAVPKDPKVSFGTFQRGDDLTIQWTPAGTQRVLVRLDGELDVFCEADDDGELTIPADWTGRFTGDGTVRAHLKAVDVEVLRPGEDTVVWLSGEAIDSTSWL